MLMLTGIADTSAHACAVPLPTNIVCLGSGKIDGVFVWSPHFDRIQAKVPALCQNSNKKENTMISHISESEIELISGAVAYFDLRRGDR